MICIKPRRLAEQFKDLANLVTCEPPFPQRKFPLAMLWHRRLSKDPGLTWLRNTLAQVTAKIGLAGDRL